MSLEKGAPTDSDSREGTFQTPDESQLSHSGLDNKSDTEVQPPVDGPPDGGTGAWLAVLGAWCCSFTSFGWMNSKLLPARPETEKHSFTRHRLTSLAGVGVFQAYYEFGPLKGYDSSTISWIPSLEIFFLFVLGPFVGFLFDKYGPTPLILVGTFLHVFGLMMASLATEYYQFLLAQGVCSAIGLSFLYSPGRFLPGPATPWAIPC